MSISGTAFSSDGVEVITRKVEFSLGHEAASTGRKCSQSDFSSYYEIDRCIKFILDNDYQRVALQFPDFLLCDATRAASRLTEDTAREVFILGDTSYGSCCVDEIAAEHNRADCIIHFGPSCLTRSSRLPVLFVFGKEPVDVEDTGRAFRQAFPATDQRVLVLYDTAYAHCIDELRDTIADYRNCVISMLTLPSPLPLRAPPPLPLNSLFSATSEPTLQVNTSSTSSNSTSSATTSSNTFFTSSTSSTSSSTASSAIFSASTAPNTSASHTNTCLIKSEHSCACSCGTSLVDSQGVMSVQGGSTNISSCTKYCLQPNEVCPAGSDHENNIKSTQVVCHRFGRSFHLQGPVEFYEVFYIGMEGPTLTNLLLNYSKCQFSSYNPATRQCRKETVSVNKALGRRYFLVQKAKEARTVGILVGTLGAADYLKIIERLKKILKQVGKKYYTIAVGKLNVPKIANFLEIDVFVLVACPENSLLDSRDFFKPVITPYELELACLRSKEWTGEYSTDYQELLPGACFHSALDKVENDLEPEFSLITGGFVPTKHSSLPEEGHEMTVKVRSGMEVVQSHSAAYLQTRSWRGLEQKLGETEVGVAVEGKTGIATGYTHEH